jgi:hypothetical protein
MTSRSERFSERGGIPGLVTPVSRTDEVHVAGIGRQADGGGPMRRTSKEIWRCDS